MHDCVYMWVCEWYSVVSAAESGDSGPTYMPVLDEYSKDKDFMGIYCNRTFSGDHKTFCKH